MPAINRKKITVQYRKLDDIGNVFGTKTLQDALLHCLDQDKNGTKLSENPIERQYDCGNYGTVVLNYIESNANFFFGELVRFEPGASLPLLDIGTGGKSYNLTQARAPNGHEPLRGVLYFMVIKNHVTIIENDVSSARAEQYLSWLLSQKADTLPSGSHVILIAELTSLGATLQLTNVDEVVFKPKPLENENVTPPERNLMTSTIETATRGVSETSTFEVLKAAGMDEADIQKLASKDTKIELTLQIRFKSQQRRRQALSIDDTNRLLRNIPDDELTLKGPGGRQRNGRIEKLSYPANVETVGSLLRTNDVIRALREGYNFFVNNGYIDG